MLDKTDTLSFRDICHNLIRLWSKQNKLRRWRKNGYKFLLETGNELETAVKNRQQKLNDVVVAEGELDKVIADVQAGADAPGVLARRLREKADNERKFRQFDLTQDHKRLRREHHAEHFSTFVRHSVMELIDEAAQETATRQQ